MSNPTKLGVVGCGRMGRLHARVCSQLGSATLAAVYDADRDLAAGVAHDYNAHAATTLQELAGMVDGVIIAVPTVFHAEVAEVFLSRGIACLIEKPLAPDSVTAQKLVDLAAANNVALMVGHIERFNPAVRAMLDLRVKPQFIEVIRISPLTFRSIDVGVVLDLMIHDIDIVLQLAGSEPATIDATGVSVIGSTGDGKSVEDICNARIKFANGCVANLTASRLAMKTERKLRVFSSDAYVSLDYQKKAGIFIKRGENLSEIRDTVAKIRSGEIEDLSQIDFAELVDVQNLAIDDVEPLRAEQLDFVAAVRGEKPPAVSGRDGLAAVKLAERITAIVADSVL
jgi:predicted dehydrogenase